MKVKRILVPLDASIYSEGATLTACEIAKTHGAKIAGIAVLDSPEIRSSIVPAIGPYYPMMLDAVQEKLKHAGKVLEESLECFAEACNEAGVPHIETEYEGIPAQKLLESSIFFDLMVVGLETAFHFETRGGRGDTIDQILSKTATPIVAVPPTGMKEIKDVVIAFDGSFSSSRALRDFILLAGPYNPNITLISADPDGEKSDFLLENAGRLLRAHGMDNIELVASKASIDEAIPDSLREVSDLIVLGIHSRKPVKDFFVGSFASKLIDHGDTSLFLSH